MHSRCYGPFFFCGQAISPSVRFPRLSWRTGVFGWRMKFQGLLHHRQEVGSNRRARFVPERANHTPAGSYERGMDVKQSAFTHPPCQKNVKSSPLLPGELPGLERFVYNFMIPQSCLLGGDGSWKTSLRERGLPSIYLPAAGSGKGTSMHYASTMNGVIAITLMFVNTLIWAVPVHILPSQASDTKRGWQRTCARALMNTVNCWIWGILASLRLTQKTRYHIEGLEGLSTRNGTSSTATTSRGRISWCCSSPSTGASRSSSSFEKELFGFRCWARPGGRWIIPS